MLRKTFLKIIKNSTDKIFLLNHLLIFVFINFVMILINLMFHTEILWFLYPFVVTCFVLAIHCLIILLKEKLDLLLNKIK